MLKQVAQRGGGHFKAGLDRALSNPMSLMSLLIAGGLGWKTFNRSLPAQTVPWLW